MTRTATGQLEDGTVHFTEDDIRKSDGSVSIRLLPVGETPLLLFPSAPKNSNKVYTGDPTPIVSYHDEFNNNKLSFRCQHVRVKEDEKKGTSRVVCTHYWQDGQGVTIGTILSHCRSQHWQHSSNIVSNVAGQRGVKSFFSVTKKRKSAIDANATATAGMDYGSGGENILSSNAVTSAAAGSTNTVNVAAAAVAGAGGNIDTDMAEVEVVDMGGEEQQDMAIDTSILKAPPSIVFMEYLPCRGIHYLDFNNIDFGLHYDVMRDYPWLIHSDTTKAAYQNSNLLCNVDWTVNSLGNFSSTGCNGIITRDKNNFATTTRAKKPACLDCISLQFNQRLMGVLTMSISKEYGQLPNALCPVSQILHRISKIKKDVSNHRLAEFNFERKIGSLTKQVDDHSRLKMCIQNNDVPAIDGINIDEKLGLDIDQLPHQVTGLCRHAKDATFDKYEDAERIEQSLADGDVHLAKEAEIFAIGLNHPTFTSLIPIAISPTCKKDDIVGESTNTVHEIVTTIRQKWHSYPISNNFIMATYNSDGAGQFRKGVGKVLSKDLPGAIRRVYINEEGDSRCPLLNLVGGDDGTTASCDNDHLGKRFRARIKTSMGITIGVINFNKSDLTVALQLLSIVRTPDEAHRLFHPDDLMDVLETVRCLYAVGQLSTTAFTEFPAHWRTKPENRQKYQELRVLGRVSALMCSSIVGHEDDIEEEGTHMSISEYLTVLSELAHILFIVYRRNKTNFIAAQNYRNWQEMIKNMYITVTQAKVNGVEDFYWFLNTNKRIEVFFGILRSLRGGDMNFDAEGLRSRVGDASMVSWIYSQYPEWENASRRLKSSADRKNPRSWKGDTKVANVDEVKCWTDGKNRALNVLRASRAFEECELDISSILSSEPGVDMFRPYRRTIGVLAGDRAVYSLVDLDDEFDDQEPEDGSDANANAN